ncbi:dTDP-4-dehydrorhamnose 3,5-epimerase [Vibrio cholerae]|nr:dTDP-4-dehydrorhamnose 3,5-epimerase [Vibrio cholerae]BCN21179.1 dTDP-4-dehydrorhamnose 3,5-epimerase [Vibrio cholerae]GHX81320.1 dTDP-4-dehydrorhamnose 3,5-epimerase [Vibrio cholerae]GIC07379.1 dTDP-4-dehydrorhamnose 3,5-epimerase [Vibrio cholerae]
MLEAVKEISGLYIFEPKVFLDKRGYFFEAYNNNLFQENGINFNVVQQNQSKSKRGTIRGLHYQGGEHPQAKFVRVLSGTILDVAVDLRVKSPTYGKYFSIVLSDENKKGLYIPAGFAHGFSALSEGVEVFYCCDEFYDAKSEGGIIYNDKDINIDWRVELNNAELSDKDRNLKSFKEYKINPEF